MTCKQNLRSTAVYSAFLVTISNYYTIISVFA